MFHYAFYGLSLEATCALPGLPADGVTPFSPPSLTIRMGGAESGDAPAFENPPWFTSRQAADGGLPFLRIWRLEGSGDWLFRYAAGIEFHILGQGTQIDVAWSDDVAMEQVVHYLLGQVMGFVLRIRQAPSLHASAVAIADRVAAFVGQSGAGKSTLASALAAGGHALLTDDIAPLWRQENRYLVLPGSSHVRLWPETAELLGKRAEDLPHLFDGWDKRFMDLRNVPGAFADGPAPLGAIYCLTPRRDEPDAPRVEPMSASTGLMALIANAYATTVLDDRLRAHEFEYLSRVAETVPIRRLVPHRDPSRLAQLCELVLDDMATLRNSVG